MPLNKLNSDLKPGDIINGFKVKSIDPLPKLNNLMIRLEHEKTGAEMIHLSNDDDNNCFAVAFRTTPTDSTGVAHILEHTALCGSKNYPIRDPFFSMIRRSMKTFMNAFTASDWTMYPFSSQNESDFYNLMNVYLDATFFPLLSIESFRQEGHRYEFEDSENTDSDLTIQGIVYNEMKGAMSSQSHIMNDSLGKSLFPTITYKYNSGGHPPDISSLTHQQLLDFHQKHYHPSNALIYTYGDIALNKHLPVINNVLSQFDKIPLETTVLDEKRYDSPKSFSYSYPLSSHEDDGEKCQIALAWLTCNIKNPLEILSLQLISLILLGHSGAPLRKKLLESKLGKSLADTTGFEDDIKESYFSVGLQAVAEKNIDKVEELILSSIQEITEIGISQDQIDSAIHQIELGTREISGGGYPYSLNLLFRFFGTWMHGGDPINAIDFDAILSKLKVNIQKKGYLESQIKKYIIDNPHRAKIILKPDSSLDEKQQKELQNQLNEVKSGLSTPQKQQIIQISKDLKTLQESKEDLSCLPTLQLSDIPTSTKYTEPFQQDIDNLDFTFYDCPTNGILYTNWHFKVESLTLEERDWLPLLGYILPNTGAAGLSYEKLASQVNMYTGGFSAGPSIEKSMSKPTVYRDFFSVSTKSLNRNINEMFSLGGKIVGAWDFSDLNRIQTLIAQRANGLINSIVEQGHNYALSLAGRNFGFGSHIKEIYGGIHQIQFMKKLITMEKDELESAIQKLNLLLNKLFNKNLFSILAVGEKEALDPTRRALNNFIEQIPTFTEIFPDQKTSSTNSPVNNFQQAYQKEAWLTTTPVSYVAQCHKVPEYSHEDSPVLLVLANLLKSCFLHGEIREKGGAYGGMATYNPNEGIFSLLSYRDPNLSRTYSVYSDTPSWLEKGEFSIEETKEMILQTCSGMDVPMSPAGKASSDYLADRKGLTIELRNKFRTRVLKCTKNDLIEVGCKYLKTDASMAAITSEDILKQEKDNLKNITLKENLI